MSARGWGSGYNPPAQGGRGRGSWGSGFRGGPAQQQGRGRGRFNNRFQQLSEQEANERAFALHRGNIGGGGGGGRGGGGGHGRGRAGSRGGGHVSWRETVQYDDTNERPAWALTCYGHEREGRCDLLGDTSFEELRWQQLQAAHAGTALAQIQQQFMAAVRAKEQQWQALLKAQRPPSKGGPDIAVSSDTGFGQALGPFQQAAGPLQQAAGPFQQAGGPFQQAANPFQQQMLAAAAAPFGQQPAAAPRIAFRGGEAAAPAADGFGAAGTAQPASSGGAFGSNFNSTADSSFSGTPSFGTAVAPGTFGSASPAATFGTATAVSSPTGFGPAALQLTRQQPAESGSASSVPAAAPSSAFSQHVPLATGGTFGQAIAVLAPPIHNGGTPTGARGDCSELDVWRAATFERGRIPEQPPPAELCM